jgi:hypothetical protein
LLQFRENLAEEPIRQEVRRSHPGLHRAEGMLDGLAPLTHGMWVLIEPALHGLKHGLVLPAGDATLLACGAAALDRAGSTGGRP